MTTPHETPALDDELLDDLYRSFNHAAYRSAPLDHRAGMRRVAELLYPHLTAPLKAENDALLDLLAKASNLRTTVSASSLEGIPVVVQARIKRAADAYTKAATRKALDDARVAASALNKEGNYPASSAGEDAEEESPFIAWGYDPKTGKEFDIPGSVASPVTPPAVADAGSVKATLALLADKRGSSIREVVMDALHADETANDTDMTSLQLDSHGKLIEILTLKNREQDEQIGALRRDVGAQDEVIEHWRQEVGSLGRAIDSWGQRITALEQPSAPVPEVTDAMVEAALAVIQSYSDEEWSTREATEAITAALAAQGSEATS